MSDDRLTNVQIILVRVLVLDLGTVGQYDHFLVRNFTGALLDAIEKLYPRFLNGPFLATNLQELVDPRFLGAKDFNGKLDAVDQFLESIRVLVVMSPKLFAHLAVDVFAIAQAVKVRSKDLGSRQSSFFGKF